MKNKNFKQFLIKTAIFVAAFILISMLIGQKIVASSLLMDFKIFIYGGLGKILLFSILGFILLYRDKLLKIKNYKFKKTNIPYLIISLLTTISFYILELNIDKIKINIINTILIHTLFLSIFISLIIGIFGIQFIKTFYKQYKKELRIFLAFGIITYSLMNLVWNLWPYLSRIVTKVSQYLLSFLGPTSTIDTYTIIHKGFIVKIGEACSGIYSIFIFSALYLLAILLDWKKLNKIKAMLTFIPALIGAFLVNILRVFLLMVIGANYSREIAVGLYHSYTGMIFFLIYFAIFWKLTYKWMKK